MAQAGTAAVRLSDGERRAILRAVERASGEAGRAWRRVLLFGSRADPARRGGDVDLLIEVAPGDAAGTHHLERRLRIALEDELGERKIDVVIDDGRDAPFLELAREGAEVLWTNA